jgi:hypothetical protein
MIVLPLVFGNMFLDWYIPNCGGDFVLATMAMFFAILLFAKNICAALAVLFLIGDPMIDSYTFCFLGAM